MASKNGEQVNQSDIIEFLNAHMEHSLVITDPNTNRKKYILWFRDPKEHRMEFVVGIGIADCVRQAKKVCQAALAVVELNHV